MFKFAAILALGVGAYFAVFAKVGAKSPSETSPEEMRLQTMQLKHVNDGEITGIWVLSPRSTFLLNPNQSITGRRSSISLEAWGGGEANVSVGKFTADGPIAWNVKPSRSGAATLHLTSQSGKIALQFASFNDRMCLACEVPHPQNGKPQIIRFLKASDRPAKSSLPFH